MQSSQESSQQVFGITQIDQLNQKNNSQSFIDEAAKHRRENHELHAQLE